MKRLTILDRASQYASRVWPRKYHPGSMVSEDFARDCGNNWAYNGWLAGYRAGRLSKRHSQVRTGERNE